jgi:hypothetical protein
MSNFIQNIFGNASATKKIREATELVSESLKEAGYPERVQDVYDNIEHNENGLALENLCENLYEFSCPIPQRAYDLLEEAGTAMKIDSKYWEMLKSQVIS